MNCTLPDGFSILHQNETSINIWLRYNTKTNFIGREIVGYYTNKAIVLTTLAHDKLLQVEKEVNSFGYDLVVYDAYRPAKTVKYFEGWVNNQEDQVNKRIYYPNVDKSELISRGYIADKSSHSRGSTVDLTIIRKDAVLNKNPILSERELTTGRQIPYYDDSTVDMGSSFDLFDPASWINETGISNEQFGERMFLKYIMEENGFKSYMYEWWHYTLDKEPYPDTYFNFDVCG